MSKINALTDEFVRARNRAIRTGRLFGT